MEDTNSPDEPNITERNLCVMYGDHDDCPFKEVDEQGVAVTCNCSCHLYSEASPE